MSLNTSSFDYTHLSADDLSREWLFRARVPDHLTYFEEWERDSQAAREIVPGRLDLEYGDHPAERLDLFVPEGVESAPLLVFSHGGYWQAMSKEYSSFLAPPFLERGVAVAIIGHPLCPDVEVRDIVEANRRAIAFLADGAGTPGFKPSRIVISGHSAGGQVAALFGIDSRKTFPLPGGLLAGAIAISPILDLEAILPTAINHQLGLDVDAAREVSPIRHLPKRGARLIPLILCTGGDEAPLLLQQQKEFARMWRGAGGEVVEQVPAGMHHFNVVRMLAQPGSDLFEATLAMLIG